MTSYTMSLPLLLVLLLLVLPLLLLAPPPMLLLVLLLVLLVVVVAALAMAVPLNPSCPCWLRPYMTTPPDAGVTARVCAPHATSRGIRSLRVCVFVLGGCCGDGCGVRAAPWRWSLR